MDEASIWLVDLNRASRAELLVLPGVGSERAEAILAGRSVRPFASLAELVERGVLPLSIAEGLLDLAEARP